MKSPLNWKIVQGRAAAKPALDNLEILTPFDLPFAYAKGMTNRSAFSLEALDV